MVKVTQNFLQCRLKRASSACKSFLVVPALFLLSSLLGLLPLMEVDLGYVSALQAQHMRAVESDLLTD